MNPQDVLTDLLDTFNSSLGGVLTGHVTEVDSILTEHVVDLDDTATRHAITFEDGLSAANQALLSALSVVVFDFTSNLNAGMVELVDAIYKAVIPSLPLPTPQPAPGPQPSPNPTSQPTTSQTPTVNQSAGNMGPTSSQQSTASTTGPNPVTVNVNVPKQPERRDTGRMERERREPQGGRDLLDKALNATVGRMLAVLTPLASFGTILVQSTSGLRIFLSAVNILAMSLAPILLPGFVLLSALILTVADIINAQLQPAMVEWYTLILGKGFAAVMSIVEGFERAYNAAKSFAGDIEQLGSKLKELIPDKIKDEDTVWKLDLNAALGRKEGPIMTGPGFGGKPADQKPAARGPENFGGGGDWGDETPEKKKTPPTPFGKEFGTLFIKNIKEVAQEFRHQNQPRTELTSLVAASRQAQLAATGMSVFEQRQIRLQEMTVKNLDLAVDKLDKMTRGGVVE